MIFCFSYAGDCDIRFSVKGIKGGIKDLQVSQYFFLNTIWLWLKKK